MRDSSWAVYKVKLLLYWKRIVLSLILHQALSSSISVHISPGSIFRKIKVGNFQDLAHLLKDYKKTNDIEMKALKLIFLFLYQIRDIFKQINYQNN